MSLSTSLTLGVEPSRDGLHLLTMACPWALGHKTQIGTPHCRNPRGLKDQQVRVELRALDATRVSLMTSLVNDFLAARALELDYFKIKEVWVVRKISEVLKRTGRPPITVRWVEVNEGDDLNPKIRSRLVA